MARYHFIFVTAVLATLFLDVQGAPDTEALSLPSPKSLVEDAIKDGEKILNATINVVKGAVQKAKDFVEKLKSFIRGVEDKFVNNLPTPLKQIVQSIRDLIHRAEDFGGNATHCVTDQGPKALQIVNDAARSMVECATVQIKEAVMVLADMQTLINDAEDLIRDAPGQLWSCLKVTLSPTEAIAALSCVNEKIKVFNARSLLLLSSLAGDLGALGKQGFEMPLQITQCEIYHISGTTSQVGDIVQNIGGCLQKVISSQLG